MVKNETIYNGKIRFKFEKYPHYSNGINHYNKTHLNLGFTKLVSRIKSSKENLYNKQLLNEIANKTKLRLVTSFYDNELNNIKVKDGVHNSYTFNFNNSKLDVSIRHDSYTVLVHYTNDNNDYIGLDFGYFAYKYNMIATEHAQVFAKVENDEIIGYCGYSHRATTTFKIGDKLFESTWMPESGYESTRATTPFIKHGYKTIEHLDEAKQAALNFAKYVS